MGSIEESIALVLDRDRGRSVGLAFLVTNRLVLTCAHAVNTSLGPLREATPVSDKVVGWLPRSHPMGPVGRHRRRVSEQLRRSAGAGLGLSGGPA